MSSSSSTFSLPSSFRSGTDRISKEVARHPDVVNIITKALTNTQGDYIPEITEWQNGTRSDLVLIPKATDIGLSPIIIEIQRSVDEKFMKRAISYCLQAYQRFGINPILLIVCVDSVRGSPSDMLQQSERLPCYTLPCDLWASECLILNWPSIQEHIVADATLDPFVAFGLFITQQATDILLIPKTDPTLELLNRISYDSYKATVGQDFQLVDELQQLSDMYCKQYEKILDLMNDEHTPRSSILEFVTRSYHHCKQQKRKLDELNAANDIPDTQPQATLSTYEKGMEFVDQFRIARIQKGQKMDWALCLSEGQKKDLLLSYKNSNSLRVQFSKFGKKSNQ